MSLRNREEAADWIDAHQLARRNLNPKQAALIRGRRYERLKRAEGHPPKELGQSELVGPTADRLAKEHGVSASTVKRDAAFARDVEALKEVEPEIEAKIIGGEGPTRKAVHEAAATAKVDAHTGGNWRASEKKSDAVVSDIVLDEPFKDTGHNEVEYYGGHLICESVRPQNRPIIAAAPDMLMTLDAVRNFLWGQLCDLNMSTAADHPTARMFLRVEAAIETARHARRG